MGNNMKNFLKGLFYYENGLILSQTKFWNNIGIGTVTFLMIYLGMYKEIPEWLGWIYVVMITPTKLVNKIITLRWGYSTDTSEKNPKGE